MCVYVCFIVLICLCLRVFQNQVGPSEGLAEGWWMVCGWLGVLVSKGGP